MNVLGIDDGLLRRLREAGRTVAWRPAPSNGRGAASTTRRLARLRDEEARVETVERVHGATVEVTAGPVGALVLLLEADRRGPPSSLGSKTARAGAFPAGSIVAAWGDAPVPADARPTIRDLVDLARYALL